MTQLSPFDRERLDEQSPYGEAVRLANWCLPQSSYTVTDEDTGVPINVPAVIGMRVETCTYQQIIDYLDRPVEIHPSLFWFLVRVIILRFPSKHRQFREQLTGDRRHEWDVLVSERPSDNEVEWLGMPSYTCHTRADGSMDSGMIDDRNKYRRPYRK